MRENAKNQWRNIGNVMANLAMENDIDGLSDERENRNEEEWYTKYLKGYADLYDDYDTTMRQAAKKYLDETKDSERSQLIKNNIYNKLAGNDVSYDDGRTVQQRIQDFDRLAQDLSQDYRIAMNPDKYNDLMQYSRIRDTGGLRFEDDPPGTPNGKTADQKKLELYAQYYTDYERGGEKYANQKLAQYFIDKMHENQSVWEYPAHVYARFQDDIASSLLQCAAVAHAVTPLGWAMMAAGVDEKIAVESGLYTEEDVKRTHE